MAISSSHHPEVFYKLASDYFLDEQNEKALRALKEAVEQGFSDRERLEKDKSFDLIREKNEFKALLEALKKK